MTYVLYFEAIPLRPISTQKLINTGKLAGGKGKNKEVKPIEKKVKNSNCPTEKFALEKV